jgi:hypothetical protein
MEDVLTYTEGNFGARRGGMARGAPQRVLVAAQWVVLMAGVVGFKVAGPRGLLDEGVDDESVCRRSDGSDWKAAGATSG